MHSDLFFQVSGRDGKIPKLVRFKLFLCLSSSPVASTSTLPFVCQNNSYQHVPWKLWAVILYLEREGVTYNRVSKSISVSLRYFLVRVSPKKVIVHSIIHVLKERHCI